MKYRNLVIPFIILAYGCGCGTANPDDAGDVYAPGLVRDQALTSRQQDTAYENILFGISPVQYEMVRGRKVVQIGRMLYMKFARFDEQYGLYQFALISAPVPLSEESTVTSALEDVYDAIQTKYESPDTLYKPTYERAAAAYHATAKWVIGNKTIEIARYRDKNNQTVYGMCTIERVDVSRIHQDNKATAIENNLEEEGRKF